MKGTDMKWFLAILLFALLVGKYLIEPSFNSYSDMITFLSIMIGFKITSLSIIFNSPLKKILYDRQISLYKTELHRLRAFYQHSIYFDVISVFLIFIVPARSYIINVSQVDITIGKYLLVLPILLGSFFCFYKVFGDLLKIFAYPTNEKV
ncbi:MAG: hypothetical protein JKY87_02510 [Mariprofundus sp.]|nr:hypothetical protein [Mariprofundus sp.]